MQIKSLRTIAYRSWTIDDMYWFTTYETHQAATHC